MTRPSVKKLYRVLAVGLLIVGGSYWHFIVRPAISVRNALRLLAATQVGKTTADEFQKMAIRYGVDVDRVRSDKFPDTFSVAQNNRLLARLHLAQPKVVGINADVNGGVVTAVKVWAWIGNSHEFASIRIEEFETRYTGCGDVPVCIKPYSSTPTTSVFFVPSTPIAQREHLLSLNWWCLAKIGGCKSSREFFPAAWEHEEKQGS